jgi:arsenate reductase
MKKVLILCTGNSCRSIIGEALINKYLNSDGIRAFSAGSNPSGRVNPNAKKVLQENAAWSDEYCSKSVEEVQKNAPFNLVVTVCDNAKENCPFFEGAKKQLHLGFEDPDGKEYSEFEKTYKLIKEQLLPFVKEELK